ncbi:hypothetical protein AGABI2DRAFT_76039, partial [Agaricus bisporus var. bisporus H97]|uniref:hypothetical protein n=1 Tax=Agaricus bisporus var. bisporus (strain H97 / ATCC MYA-4626 / FGSC 10389) TaxID=936046 RepID=UPI00029F7BC1
QAKDPEHVAAGYKATIHNPNVSQEAKDHAWKELHKMGIHDLDSVIHEVPKHAEPVGQSVYSEAKNEGNVIGGYKATLKNPHVSESAKRHAERELKERGIDTSNI